MEDNLNQGPEMNEEVMIDFGDDNDSDAVETEETEVVETEAEPTEAPTETEPEAEENTTEDADGWLEVKYNGEEQKLSREQAIEYAQKGMNYDKVNERYQEVINSPIMQIVQQQAQAMGITVDEYANRLQQFQQVSKRNEIIESYKEKFPDVSDAAAEEYADLALQAQTQKMQEQQQAKAMQAQQAQQAEVQKQLEDFLKAYPDIDVETIPDEVINATNNGETLLSAYRAHENKLLREKLDAERKNQSNKQKSAGRLNENASNQEAADPFLAGLLG